MNRILNVIRAYLSFCDRLLFAMERRTACGRVFECCGVIAHCIQCDHCLIVLKHDQVSNETMPKMTSAAECYKVNDRIPLPHDFEYTV